MAAPRDTGKANDPWPQVSHIYRLPRAAASQAAVSAISGLTGTLNRIDPRTNNEDIYLLDLARGIPTRFTFNPDDDIDPVWSPDGRFVAFSSHRGGRQLIYRKLATGAGTEEMLYEGSNLFGDDWSRDGRTLLFSDRSPETNTDLYTLGVDRGSKPTPVLNSKFNETQGQFSPDGHWIAYQSDESGTREIYVQSFPVSANGGKWRISDGGGAQPRWRRDGKELFFVANDRLMMATEITTLPAFRASVPKQLFAMPINPGGANVFRWDVFADGQTFLVIASAQEMAGTPLTMVLNWTALLPK